MRRKLCQNSKLIAKLQGLWVFLIFFLLPIFLFSGIKASPVVEQKVAAQKEKVVEHRKDWDKYLNPKRVAESGKQKLERFSDEVLEPIALDLEQRYVEAVSPPGSVKPQIPQEDSDF